MRGYALWELVITLVFFALVAIVAVRALDVERRPAPPDPVPVVSPTPPAFEQYVAPFIDASLGDIYDSPLSPAPGSVDHGEYRGPASDVNTYGDADPVGADIDGNHGPGQGGIVLRKSGDAMNCPATDPLWQAAAERTAP